MLERIKKLLRKDRNVTHQWMRGHQYELRHVWVSVDDAPTVLRYAWYRDDGRKVSAFYRSHEMALVNFGNFDPTEMP